MTRTLSASPAELVIQYELGDTDVIRVAVEPGPADVVEFKRELSLDMLEAGPGSTAAERAAAAARFGEEHGYVTDAQPEDAAETNWTVRLELPPDPSGPTSG